MEIHNIPPLAYPDQLSLLAMKARNISPLAYPNHFSSLVVLNDISLSITMLLEIIEKEITNEV